MRHPRELAFRFPLPDAPDQTQKKLLSNRPAPNVEEPAATALLLRNARRVEPALELLETRFFILLLFALSAVAVVFLSRSANGERK